MKRFMANPPVLGESPIERTALDRLGRTVAIPPPASPPQALNLLRPFKIVGFDLNAA
jgi:hypothetical protein